VAKRQLTATTVLALTTLREQATKELGGLQTAAAIRVGTTAATEAAAVTWRGTGGSSTHLLEESWLTEEAALDRGPTGDLQLDPRRREEGHRTEECQTAHTEMASVTIEQS